MCNLLLFVLFVARVVIMTMCALRNMVFPIKIEKRLVITVIERFAHIVIELVTLLIYVIRSMVTHPVIDSRMVRLFRQQYCRSRGVWF